MKKIPVEKSVGMVLAHDITRIVPGEFKGVGFKKGHVVCEKDIPELLKLGKRHLYALNLSDATLHEDDAALRIARAVSGDQIRWTDPVEGKSSMIARSDGLFKVDARSLLRINKIPDIIISTLKNNFPCTRGQVVAATRIIPLTINRKKIDRMADIAEKSRPVLRVLPFKKMKVGAVVTGDEVFKGLIPDGFDAFVGKTLESHGCRIAKKIVVPDDPAAIADAVTACRNTGVELIVTTGGLSVDPDDVTRDGVRRAGAKNIAYGTPVLPGAMFLYARIGDIPLLGLPACVYYHSTTIFNLILPRVLAGEEITRDDLAGMGHGGLCMNCDVCRYPVCPFGK